MRSDSSEWDGDDGATVFRLTPEAESPEESPEEFPDFAMLHRVDPKRRAEKHRTGFALASGGFVDFDGRDFEPEENSAMGREKFHLAGRQKGDSTLEIAFPDSGTGGWALPV